MIIPEFTMRQLLEAGVHFGHRTSRWNPRMDPYIFGARGGIHVIDLTQTVPLLHRALVEVHKCVAKGGRLLMVATKSQARQPIRLAAERGQQFFINNRWLGGTLTNWKTVSASIKRLDGLEAILENPDAGFAKKERLKIDRQHEKLIAALGGIRQMERVPDMLFVIDVHEERLAIQEARKMGIPVVAVVDTNSDPTGIDFPIPGNDDATRAIELYCDLVLRVLLSALEEQFAAMGVDAGTLAAGPTEVTPESDGAPAPAEQKAPAVDDTTVPVASAATAESNVNDLEAGAAELSPEPESVEAKAAKFPTTDLAYSTEQPDAITTPMAELASSEANDGAAPAPDTTSEDTEAKLDGAESAATTFETESTEAPTTGETPADGSTVQPSEGTEPPAAAVAEAEDTGATESTTTSEPAEKQ